MMVLALLGRQVLPVETWDLKQPLPEQAGWSEPQDLVQDTSWMGFI